MFGAGTSISSGAPSGIALSKILSRKLGDEFGDDLSEIAQIYENRFGRKVLVDAIKQQIVDLSPASGLLALPTFDWLSIYTTNYDTLIEKAYGQSNRELNVIRSNFDVSSPREASKTSLYKIHGCVTQDVSMGHQSRMIITESDYDDHEKYRQTLFNSLRSDMFTADTVIIGQSLKDRHLKDLVKEVCNLRTEGVNTRIFLMVHSYDEDRAALFTRLGVNVVHGDLEDLLLALVSSKDVAGNLVHTTSSQIDDFLTPDLVLTSIQVRYASKLPSNPVSLFNGSPASYADIFNGQTIKRAALGRIEAAKTGARSYFIVVEGSRGVGKTTMARSYVLNRMAEGLPAWEHLSDHPLDYASWLAVESKLRQENKDGILFIDDCTRHLKSVNRLVDRLNEIARPHLRIIVTTESSKWKVSTKSAGFFSRGTLIKLSILERNDIDELVNLVDRRPEIRSLVETRFLELSRGEKVRQLREKCSADMFVCLKNIFANDNLDNILLHEFFELSDESQEVYRYVAAVQSMGGYVHRQLIMRIMGIGATGLDDLLNQLDGIVAEHVIDNRQGVYGWRTRHDVIAETIAKWKFADQNDLYELLESLIRTFNPQVRIELETALAIATNDAGIHRLTDTKDQIKLYRSLIDAIPANRTPRRRLIRLFLKNELLVDAENEIIQAEKTLGQDAIVSRYRATLTLRKADLTPAITESDRVAMLYEALGIIRRCIRDYYQDVYTYRTLGEIGLALIARDNDFTAFDDAIDYLRRYESENGDPNIRLVRRHLEQQARSIGVEPLSLPVEFPEEDFQPAEMD